MHVHLPLAMSSCVVAMTEEALSGRDNCRRCMTQPSCPVARLQGEHVASLQIKEQRFSVGDVLQAQGVVSTSIRIIKSGSTMLCRASDYGDRQPIGVLGRGTVIGQFGLRGRTSPVTHIAILDGSYCELSNAALQCSGLLDTPAFLGAMSDFMAHAVEKHFNWCQLRSGDGVARQLAGALLHLSDLQSSLRVRLPTQATLAELLGTTRESITRAFALLEKNGNLSRHGRHYCDLQVPQLLQTLQSPDASRPA